MTDESTTAPARAPGAPSEKTHPCLYTAERLADGRIAVQCTAHGKTYPVEYFADLKAAAARMQELVLRGAPDGPSPAAETYPTAAFADSAEAKKALEAELPPLSDQERR